MTKSSQVANFRTIDDICYQYQAGFQIIPELVELTGYPGVQKFVTALIQSLQHPLPPPPPIGIACFLHIQTDDDLDDRVIYTHWDRLLWVPSTGEKFSFICIKTILISGLPTSSINIYMVNWLRTLLFTAQKFPEELRHIFLGCPRSHRMWKIVTYHLSIITSKPPPPPLEVQKFIVMDFADPPPPPHTHPLFKRQKIYASLFIFPFGRDAQITVHLLSPPPPPHTP